MHFLLFGTFGRLEYFICKTLESIIVLGLMLSLGVKNADAIQEAFKFPWLGPVLLIPSWLLHRIDEMIRFPLLVVDLGRAWLVHVARVLLHLLFPGVEGHLLSQGVPIGNGEHCFGRPGVLHGDLSDQGRIPESLLEEHNDRLVVDLWDDIPLVAEALNEHPEGVSLLLDNAS
jgi:hypothetical protein